MTATATRPPVAGTRPVPPPTGRDRGTLRDLVMALLGACATVATLATVGPAFRDDGWITGPLSAVAIVVVIGVLWRRWRPGSSLTALVQLIGFALFITVYYAGDVSIAHVLPTPQTLRTLVDLIADGAATAQEKVAPITSTAGTSLMIALLTGPVAIVVDDCAIRRRPALAGIPLLALFAVGVAVVRVPLSAWGFAWPLLSYLALLWADHAYRRAVWRHRRPVPVYDGALGAVGIAAIATVAGLLVPAVISLHDGGVFTSRGGARSPGTTVARSTDLGGQLNQPTPINLFTVRTSDDDPYYLRTAVLDRWTPDGWTMVTPQASGIPLDSLPGSPADVASVTSTTTITVQGYADSFVPTYGDPTSVDITGRYEYDARTSVLYSKDETLHRETYSFTSERPTPTAQQLSSAGSAVPGAIAARDLQTPRITGLVSSLVQQITSGATTNYAKALALETFFADPANGFQYSFDVPAGDSGDKLTDFLVGRTGFCEQYASAMAGMLRVAGVPARVVVGYTGGRAEQNGDRQVTTSDAHAWVEAYFDGIGWVPFDTTPIGSRGEAQPYEASQQPADTQSPTGPAASAPTATQGPTTPAPTSSGSSAQRSDGSDSTSTGLSITLLTWLTMAAVLVIGAASMPIVARGRRRARRLGIIRSGPPASAAHAAWQELTHTAADLGLSPNVSETPRARFRAWTRHFGLGDRARAAAARVQEREELARYAPDDDLHTVSGPHWRHDLRSDVRVVRDEMRSHAGKARRWRALLLPQRWRQ